MKRTSIRITGRTSENGRGSITGDAALSVAGEAPTFIIVITEACGTKLQETTWFYSADGVMTKSEEDANV